MSLLLGELVDLELVFVVEGLPICSIFVNFQFEILIISFCFNGFQFAIKKNFQSFKIRGPKLNLRGSHQRMK